MEIDVRLRLLEDEEGEEEDWKAGGGGGVAMVNVRLRLREDGVSSGRACGGCDEAMYAAMERGANVRMPLSNQQRTAYSALRCRR